MDEAQKTMLSAVGELFFTYGVKQTKIFNIITKHLLERVNEYPKRKVLHNSSYGSYELSDTFQDFVFQQPQCQGVGFNLYFTREKYAKYISPFGKRCIEDISQRHCVYFKDILYMHHEYKFKEIFVLVYLLRSQMVELEHMKNNLEALKKFLHSNPEEPIVDEETYCPPGDWCLMYNNVIFKDHKIHDWRALLEKHSKGELAESLNAKIEELTSKILDIVPSHVFNEIMEYTAVTQPQPFQPMPSRKTFIDSVNEFGLEDKHSWKYQTYFTANAMLYLFMKYKESNTTTSKDDVRQDGYVYDFVLDQHVPIDTIIMDRVEEEFGLICASGFYCMLAIAEVPSMVDYKIKEYDGLETVYVV